MAHGKNCIAYVCTCDLNEGIKKLKDKLKEMKEELNKLEDYITERDSDDSKRRNVYRIK